MKQILKDRLFTAESESDKKCRLCSIMKENNKNLLLIKRNTKYLCKEDMADYSKLNFGSDTINFTIASDDIWLFNKGKVYVSDSNHRIIGNDPDISKRIVRCAKTYFEEIIE
jgi:hypothetical protein